MSDTPETDHAALLPKDGADWRDVVLVDFARKLERERDESRKKTQWKQIRIEVLLRLNQKLHSELAEQQDNDLQAELAAWELLDEARRERDEWKEVAEGSLLGAIKERDEAVRSCHIWQDGYRALLDERDRWKAEAERWRECQKDD